MGLLSSKLSMVVWRYLCRDDKSSAVAEPPNRTEVRRTWHFRTEHKGLVRMFGKKRKRKKFLQANKLVILYLIFMSWLLILYLLFSHFPPLWFMPIQWWARLHWRHLKSQILTTLRRDRKPWTRIHVRDQNKFSSNPFNNKKKKI